MRIVHVPHAYHPVVGGTEINCKRVSEAIAALGHDVSVVTTNVGAVQGYYEFGIGRIDTTHESIGGLTVTRLPFAGWCYSIGGWVVTNVRVEWLRVRLAGRIMALLHRRLAEMITQQIVCLRPDVVMTMPHLVSNVLAVLKARQSVQFPLVMVPMLHEHDPNWDANAMKEALRWADAVVAMTMHEADRLVDAYGVARQKVFHASVGIDTEAPGPPLAERPQRVAFLGRKVKSKGISDLIDAMQVVWSAMPTVELWIAGARLPETAEVDRRIAALPDRYRQKVKDVGAIVEAEKPEFLGSARCLVLPSKTESFGMVILDAWAHATPVVTWDIPVFRSIVENGRTGIMADQFGGPRALGEAILRVLSDPDAAARMGQAGHRLATSAYSWDAVAGIYLNAYEYAVRNARRP